MLPGKKRNVWRCLPPNQIIDPSSIISSMGALQGHRPKIFHATASTECLAGDWTWNLNACLACGSTTEPLALLLNGKHIFTMAGFKSLFPQQCLLSLFSQPHAVLATTQEEKRRKTSQCAYVFSLVKKRKEYCDSVWTRVAHCLPKAQAMEAFERALQP